MDGEPEERLQLQDRTTTDEANGDELSIYKLTSDFVRSKCDLDSNESYRPTVTPVQQGPTQLWHDRDRT